jgi:GNAT superfamily N-acetyltransferase
MTIRPLIEDDIPSIRELAALADAEGFCFLSRFLDELTFRRVDLDAPDEFFVGMRRDDRLVAIGGVTPDPYVDDEQIGRLRHLYVRPDARRGGIGRELVAHLEARATLRYTSLRLRTDTASAAQFYERLGYVPIESESATHQRMLLGEFRSHRQQGYVT